MGQSHGTDPELSYRVHQDNSWLRPQTLPACNCATQSRTPKQMGHKHAGLLLNVSEVLAQVLHRIVLWACTSWTRAQFIAHCPCSCSPAMRSAMLLPWVNGQCQPKLWKKPQKNIQNSAHQHNSRLLGEVTLHITGLCSASSAQLGEPVQAAEDARLRWISEHVFLAQASQVLGKVFINFQEKLQSVLIKIHRFFLT